jgi:hypothetical protein
MYLERVVGGEMNPQCRRYPATSGAMEKMESDSESGVVGEKYSSCGREKRSIAWLLMGEKRVLVAIETGIVRREVWRMTRRTMKRVRSPGTGCEGMCK